MAIPKGLRMAEPTPGPPWEWFVGLGGVVIAFLLGIVQAMARRIIKMADADNEEFRRETREKLDRYEKLLDKQEAAMADWQRHHDLTQQAIERALSLPRRDG